MAFRGPIAIAPTVTPHDGDTLPLGNGTSGRLYGVDAFELGQPGFGQDGAVDLGGASRRAFIAQLAGGGTAKPTGTQTYGRPVVALTTPTGDAGKAMVRSGYALPEPKYLAGDPSRLDAYVKAQDRAIASETGAYLTAFQAPWDYRHGTSAPLMGKVPLTAEQQRSYLDVLQKPAATPGDLSDWYAQQGRAASNLHNILQYQRKFANPTAPGYFQQQDVQGTPILPDNPGLATRLLNRFNTGVGDLAALPGDLVANLAGRVGINIPSASQGVDYITAKTGFRAAPGDPNFAPRSTLERYAGSVAENAGQSVLPVMGSFGAAAKLGNTARELAPGLAPIIRNSLRDIMIAPGRNFAAEAGGVLGSGVAGQAAQDYAPNNPYINMAAQLAGGFAGGLGAGVVTSRGSPLHEAVQSGAKMGEEQAQSNAQQNLEQNASGQRKDAPNAPVGGDYLPAIQAPAGVPQWNSEGAPLVGMVDDGAGNLAPQYGIAGQPGSRPAVDRLPLTPRLAPQPPVSSGAPINTARPAIPPIPALSKEEIAARVEAWAKQQGAQPAQPGQLPDVMLHGSPRGNIDQFDPYQFSGYGLFGNGTYLTDNPGIAASYTGKGVKKVGPAADQSVYAVRQSVKNPLDMDAPADRAKWEDAAKRVLGDWGEDGYFAQLPKGATNEQHWREVEDYLSSEGVSASEGQETMDALIRSLGHDGITHIGGGRVGSGPSHRVVIALDPEQTQVAGRMSIQDIANPRQPRSPDWLDVAQQPPSGREVYQPHPVEIPEGFVLEGPQAPALPAPRSRDTLDVRGPQLPPGFVYEQPAQIGRTYPMGQRPSAEQIAQIARGIAPEDVLPIPSNEVGSLDEAASIGAGMYQPVAAPNERDALTPYTLPGQARPRRNPLDLASWLRTQGGVADTGGDLAHLGIDNRPRDMDFARDEGFLGPLVNPNGMPVDEAARAAWEAGYFPDHYDRPTPNDFLDALHETHRGSAARVFHPSDYEAIDAFNAARENRQLVEQAQAEGSPLVHDLSEPASLDDLIANSAPPSAFEDQPPSRSGRVGNISLDRLDSQEAIGRLLTNIRAKFGGFDAARRGKMTHEETASLARQLGMTPDDLIKRPVGQAMNAEQAHAMASLLAKSSDEVVKLARKAQGGTDADKAAFMQAAVRHAAIQEQVEGARAEAGRALSAMRMTASSKDVAGRIHKAIIDNAGGNDRVEEVAREILDVADTTGDPGKVTRTLQDVLKPKLGDKLSEVYINSLLSGPQTHAANFLSNSLTAALQLPEHAVAAGLGVIRGGPDRVMPGEIPARVFGMLQGTREGFRAFARTMRTGYTMDHGAKIEGAEQHAVSGIKGSIIRTPTRALSAADELFKGIARRMEINGLALRTAQGEGLTGDALKKRVADLTANPTAEMQDQAGKYARYVTFQTPLGPVGQAVSRVSQWKPMNVPVGKFVVPFVRTPANLIKYAAERSPAAPLLTDWRKDFMAGGARRDMAIAKAAVGSGAGLLFYQWAKEGKITGSGPADDNARALMQADGWQPYSIKVGDRWVSYARMDPLSTTMGVAADLATKGDEMTDSQREHAGALVTAAVIKNLSNKTWLSGVADLVDAIDDPARKAGSYARNEAASVAVPAILAQIARASDPNVRDSSTIGNAIKSRVPVLSQQVPAQLDAWGEPKQRGSLPLGLSAVAPFNVSTAKNDPVTAQLLAAGAHINLPSPSIAGVALTPEQMRAYQIAIGKQSYPTVAAVVSSPDWSTMGREQKEDAIAQAMHSVREQARQDIGFDFHKPSATSSGPALPPGFELVPPGFVIEQAAPAAKQRTRMFARER